LTSGQTSAAAPHRCRACPRAAPSPQGHNSSCCSDQTPRHCCQRRRRHCCRHRRSSADRRHSAPWRAAWVTVFLLRWPTRDSKRGPLDLGLTGRPWQQPELQTLPWTAAVEPAAAAAAAAAAVVIQAVLPGPWHWSLLLLGALCASLPAPALAAVVRSSRSSEGHKDILVNTRLVVLVSNPAQCTVNCAGQSDTPNLSLPSGSCTRAHAASCEDRAAITAIRLTCYQMVHCCATHDHISACAQFSVHGYG